MNEIRATVPSVTGAAPSQTPIDMNRADVEPIEVTPTPEGGRLLSNRKVDQDS